MLYRIIITEHKLNAISSDKTNQKCVWVICALSTFPPPSQVHQSRLMRRWQVELGGKYGDCDAEDDAGLSSHHSLSVIDDKQNL